MINTVVKNPWNLIETGESNQNQLYFTSLVSNECKYCFKKHNTFELLVSKIWVIKLSAKSAVSCSILMKVVCCQMTSHCAMVKTEPCPMLSARWPCIGGPNQSILWWGFFKQRKRQSEHCLMLHTWTESKCPTLLLVAFRSLIALIFELCI